MTRLVALLDLSLSQTYRWASVEDDAIPDYVHRIIGGAEAVREWTNLEYGLPGPKEFRVTVANVENDSGEGKSISRILTEEDPIGKPAVARIRDLDTGTDVFRLDGVLAEISSVTDTQAQIVIVADDSELFSELVPKRRTVDIYPCMDPASVRDLSHSVVVPFGTMRKAELALLVPTYIQASFNMIGSSNSFRYVDLTNVPDYTVVAGDVLEYTVHWPVAGARIALEVESAGLTLRGSGATDQNGYASHPSTDIPASLVVQRWYTRRIPFPASFTGQTLVRFLVGCENDATGSFVGRITNARILDSAGNVRHVIYDQFESPTFALVHNSNASQSHSISKITSWAYGPIRNPAAGSLTVANVYRAGRLVDPSEYSAGLAAGTAVWHVNFSRDQRDGSGNLLPITVDLVSTEFSGNPAPILQTVLGDSTDFLGKLTNSASFTAARTAYTAAGYDGGIGGGLNYQTPAVDVIKCLLLRGVRLDKNTSGAFTLTVDSSSLHTTFSVGLGQGEGDLENVVLGAETPRRLNQQVRRLRLKGLSARDHQGNEQFLLETERDVHARGRELVLELPYVQAIDVLDRECDYLAKRFLYGVREVSAEADPEFAGIQLGQLVPVTAPNRRWNGLQLEVAALAFFVPGEGQGRLPLRLTLRGYNSAIFIYTQGSNLRVDPRATQLTDYSLTPPDQPGVFIVDPPITTVKSNGVVESIVNVEANAPAANVTELVFIARRDGGDAIRAERRVACVPGETGVSAELYLDPGLTYDLECYAFNGFNVIGSQYSLPLTSTVTVPADTDLPSNNPVPSGISVTANQDGSFDITLTWNYTQGSRPADILILYWKHGAGPLSTPVSTDKGVHLSVGATLYTFHGVNPATNYRFGIAAARKPQTGGYAIAAIQAPTASPDWADISGTANFTGNVNGTPAVTVVANAANGQTAFSGTVNYRTAGAPSNNPAPTTLTSQLNTDGSVDYTLGWNYTQGARRADGFLVFCVEGNGTPGINHPHFEAAARNTPSTFAVSMTLKGYPTNRTLSFGVAAFRRTENHTEIGAIQSPTASPDWQGINAGSPNYTGDIFGLEQHTLRVRAAGQLAGDFATVDVDAVRVYTGSPVRSWHLIEINSSGQVVFADTFDVFGRNAEAINFRVEYNRRSTSNTLIAIGAHEPQTRRASNETYAQLTCASGNTFGFQQSGIPVTPGGTYTVSGWILVTQRTAGAINLDVTGTGLDTGGIILSSTNTQFERFSETFTVPGGTNAVNVRFFGNGGPNFTAFITDLFLVAGSTAESGTNLISNPSFAGGTSGWTSFTPGGGDIFTTHSNNPDTGRWGVLGCLKDMGGSAALIKSEAFRFRSSYICIGRRGRGEGNGLEVYNGKVDDDTLAVCELVAQIQSGQLVAVSGVGWSPSQVPGLPTNNPVPTGLSQTNTDTGHRADRLTWSYTQPSMSGENRLADGFVLYHQAGTTSNPTGNEIKLGISVRSYTCHWSHDQTVSYAIAAYRLTTSGMEIGPKQTTASWQGVDSSGLIAGDGIGPGEVGTTHLANLAVTSAKIANASITSAKIGTAQITDAHIANLSAAKITTGLLTVNPVAGGATAIFVDNAGKIRLKALTSSPARIAFEDASGIERVVLEGTSSGAINFTPVTDNTQSIEIGTLARTWNAAAIRANLALDLEVGGSGHIRMFGRIATSQLESAAPAAGSPNRRLPIYSTGGTFIGYLWASTT